MKTSVSNLISTLRGAAIFGVVVVHSLFTGNRITSSSDYNFFSYTVSLGKYGVELFFIISGLLMYLLYGFETQINTKKFFVRRLARVYPLWVLFLCVSILMYFMFGYGGVSSALTQNDSNASASLMSVVFLTLTFTLFFSSTLWNTVIPGGWSIQAEVFHYLLFVFLRRFQIAILFLVAGTLNILSSLVFLLTSSQKNFGGLFFLLADSWSRLSLFSTFSFFSIGIIFGFLIDKGFDGFIQAIRGNRKLYFSLGFFTLSMFTIPTPFGKTLEAVGTVVGFIVLSFYLTEKSLLNLFFVSLGKYSYFIYFAHFIVLDLVAWITRRLGLNFDFLFSQKIVLPPLILSVLAISWVLGYLSFRFIERPIINWSRKFT